MKKLDVNARRVLEFSFQASQMYKAFRLSLISLIIFCVPFHGSAQEEPQEDAVAVFGQAQDLHEKNDLAGAIRLYEKALKIVPEFPEAEYQRSVAYLAMGKLPEAEKGYRRALELRPDWTLAMTGLGSLLVQKGEFADADKILSKVLETEPQSSLALAALAESRLRTKASPAILQDLLKKIEALTAKAKPPSTIWSAQAAIEGALGKAAAAKASLANALAIDPANRMALIQMGEIAIAEGDTVKANEAVRRLEAAKGEPDSILLLRARILAYERKPDEALKQLEAIARPGQAATELRERIASVRSTDIPDLEKRLEADPTNAAILGRLCSLFRRDNPGKARVYCRRASDAEPGNVDHAVGFGAALVQDKEFEGAVNIFRKILAVAPDNATARANLATALFQLKRLPEAQTEFQWLTEHQPRSAGEYLFLGIIHDQLGAYMDAAANYHQYLRLADAVENKADIDKVTLRLPELQKLIKK